MPEQAESDISSSDVQYITCELRCIENEANTKEYSLPCVDVLKKVQQTAYNVVMNSL